MAIIRISGKKFREILFPTSDGEQISFSGWAIKNGGDGRLIFETMPGTVSFPLLGQAAS
jgi:hypothetical protein